MPICRKCDKFMKSGYKQVKTPKFGLNLKMKWCAGGLTPPDTWYDEISYECKGGCPVEEEEQPATPDDGTADYDIDEQLEKEKEPIIEKIFATEVKEIINDSIMKDPAICKMLAKNHILEILFNELFKNPCPYKTQDKYYIEVCNAIHKL